MIVVRRVTHGIVENFPARASEWALSLGLISWGYVLLGPERVFDSSPSFAPLARIMSEVAWGYVAVCAGAMRTLALIVNGTFRGTWYSEVSPYVRCGMSFVACFIWAQITWGLHTSGMATTGLAIYPTLFLLDAWNAIRAAGDGGKMRAQKHGPA